MSRFIAVAVSAFLLGNPAFAAGPDNTLLAQVGGLETLRAVISETIDGLAVDPATKRSFEGVNLTRMKAGVTDHLCHLMDGPCVYKGDSMRDVHKGMAITDDEFTGMAMHLIAAFQHAGVSAPTIQLVLQKLQPLKPDIVIR